MEVFVVWLFFSILVGLIASRYGRSGFGYFLLAVIITPLLALLVLLIAGRKNTGPTPDTHVRCPDCKELVLNEAKKCKHCGCLLVPQSAISKAGVHKRTDATRYRQAPRTVESDLPERDAWEDFITQDSPSRSLAKNLKFEYVDREGNHSIRRVSTIKFTEGLAGRLYAYCHGREANRTFLFSGIKNAVDTETGEMIERLSDYMLAEWKKTPAPVLEALVENHGDALKLLLFMVKADGAMHKKETTLVADLCRYIMRDDRLTDEMIHDHLKKMDVPAPGSIRNIFQSLKQRDPELAEMTRKTCERIASQGKDVHPMEKAALELMS